MLFLPYGSQSQNVCQNLGSDGTADKTLQWSVLSESPSSCAAKARYHGPHHDSNQRGAGGSWSSLQRARVFFQAVY